MPVENITQNQFFDIFGDGNQEPSLELPEQQQITPLSEKETDIFNLTPPEGEENQETEIKPEGEESEIKEEVKEDQKEVDIFENKAGRKPKNNFADIAGYFEDRIKNGKFVAIEEDTEEGRKPFLPKTPEEFDEVIDIQVNHQLEKKQKELEESWYTSKSPAWQVIAKYAEMVKDPGEILPFISGISTMQNVQELNPEDMADAEKIVRIRMEQKGEHPEVIEEQIEAFKTANKLNSTAEKYKPMLLQQQMQELQQMRMQKEHEEKEYQDLVYSIRDGVIKTIETPLFGKNKLKQEEKAAIFDLIGAPSPQTKGYGIYNEIDNLFEKRDFDTLTQIALFLKKKDSFINYISNSAKEKTAETLQRKLRVATDMRSTTGRDNEEEEREVVTRNKFSGRFGR